MTTTHPKIVSEFATVDVKQGRSHLAALLRSGASVRVQLTVQLDRDSVGNDDGVSTEFGGTVTDIVATSEEE